MYHAWARAGPHSHPYLQKSSGASTIFDFLTSAVGNSNRQGCNWAIASDIGATIRDEGVGYDYSVWFLLLVLVWRHVPVIGDSQAQHWEASCQEKAWVPLLQLLMTNSFGSYIATCPGSKCALRPCWNSSGICRFSTHDPCCSSLSVQSWFNQQLQYLFIISQSPGILYK